MTTTTPLEAARLFKIDRTPTHCVICSRQVTVWHPRHPEDAMWTDGPYVCIYCTREEGDHRP